MNFEQRMEIISKWLIMDLARYERPANFSESHVKPEVELMAGDINSEISTAYNAEGLKGLLLRIGQQVRKTHKSRRWPVIAEYVNAAKDSQRDKPLQIEDNQPHKFDSDRIAAKRINAGEPVAQSYITGTGATRLIEKNLVKPQQIETYHKSLEKLSAEVYAERKPVQYTEHDPIEELMENPY